MCLFLDLFIYTHIPTDLFAYPGVLFSKKCPFLVRLRHDTSFMLKSITINKAKDKKLDGGIPQQTGVRKRKADG